ncbi:hypothetical protein PIB30_072099 [Stylosanthes scabra]|uniref:Integrase catalytic domain-containing protein n=1 Tax=Stylosanthes scabra TaxID=79078 RepID=A0ABU6XQ80_9FABA|nr:hypothetical protein [Stylosanthes scabra]
MRGALIVCSKVAKRVLPPCSWFLPWTFARDVLNDIPEDLIIREYENMWMPCTTKLLRVYVLIYDGVDAWYMMLIDIKRRRVYALDVARTTETEQEKEMCMEKILLFIGKLFRKPRNIINFAGITLDFKEWEYFLYPEGLPSDIDSSETAVWVLAWIMHHSKFARGHFGYVGSPDLIRMKIAIGLASCAYNSLRRHVDSNAETLWRKIKK